jgi:NADPH-dependent curcumin reductase CurA
MEMKSRSGQRVILARNPTGALAPSDFRIEEQPAIKLGDGEFLVRNLFVSVDPMLRLLIDAAPLGGMVTPMPAGSVIPGAAVGEIVESRHPDFHVGERVEGRFGWQHFAVSTGASVNRVSPLFGGPENALGIGGLPGFTAFVGLERAQEKATGTVLVSGAAGAVGSMVGPMVCARGGRAVGIASGAEKCRYLVEEAAYAATADRTAPDFEDQLAAALPDGADLYFDNVGGPMMAKMMPFMARGSRVLICGLMAQYQEGSTASGPDNLPAVLYAVMGKDIRIEAFTQLGQDAMRPAFEKELARLIEGGAVKPRVSIETGIERLPYALAGLFDRAVIGKVVVKVAEPLV